MNLRTMEAVIIHQNELPARLTGADCRGDDLRKEVRGVISMAVIPSPNRVAKDCGSVYKHS
jgi:hypothetical protein